MLLSFSIMFIFPPAFLLIDYPFRLAQDMFMIDYSLFVRVNQRLSASKEHDYLISSLRPLGPLWLNNERRIMEIF